MNEGAIIGGALYAAAVFLLPLLAIALIKREILLRKHDQWLASIEWVMLEIKLPLENIKTPKAMEQVFASMYGMFSFGISFKDKWLKGRIEQWMTFELVGFASRMHFIVRLPKPFRRLFETSLYSQYPGAELEEIEDYVHRFGKELPNDEYDLFGVDLGLLKDDPYPLKTYYDFEAVDEDKRIDPIATIAEIMANLKSDEMVWIQILIRPTGADWKKKAADIVLKVTGRNAPPKPKSGMQGVGEFMGNLVNAPLEQPTWSTEKKPEAAPPKPLTPGEQELLTGVEGKVGKIGFDTIVRFMYLDKKTAFTDSNVWAVMGAIRQFNGQNEFLPNKMTLTTPKATGLFFRNYRLLGRKRKLFKAYCERAMPVEPRRFGTLRLKTSVLTVDELATLFHPPIASVAARTIRYVGAKKSGPPSDLPILE